jgi:lipoprotein-anchoring transpeptidase ErfK/SrfK
MPGARIAESAQSNSSPAIPANQSIFTPQPAQNVLEAQLALARQGICSGSLDGVLGSQTRAALCVFQEQQQAPVTGILDSGTRALLFLTAPAYTNYTTTANDTARLQPLARTWLGKSQQSYLDYETLLELVAERGHAHPDLIRRLNPAINWTNEIAGLTVTIPAADYPAVHTRAAFLRIRLAAKTLQVFDANRRLLAHFPCSIARRVEKRPVGELRIVTVTRNPNYVFNPEMFPESPEARAIGRKLVLPPGPNNPVGTAWIGLNRPGYGIHGTPNPEEVGRTESHGCFRLANWNAEYLAQLVTAGMPVLVEP